MLGWSSGYRYAGFGRWLDAGPKYFPLGNHTVPPVMPVVLYFTRPGTSHPLKEKHLISARAECTSRLVPRIAAWNVATLVVVFANLPHGLRPCAVHTIYWLLPLVFVGYFR